MTNEKIIERIEEAVTGEALFLAIAAAFRSLGSPEDLEANVVNPIEISPDDFEELPEPLPENNLYFITDE